MEVTASNDLELHMQQATHEMTCGAAVRGL